MSQTRIIVTEEHATTRLTVSPLGLQGPPGTSGLTVDELAAINGAASPDADNPFATMSIFDGLTKLAVVDELPTPQVTGTLYFVKP
jgi:hypothetical protein